MCFAYHLEFRYAEDLNDLQSWFEGNYAYWNAAAIAENYDQATMENVIELFATENPDVRVDLDYSGDLVRGAVRLGRAVEQMTDDAPQYDGTTKPLHIDSKRRKKLRQKKTALGHAEDDHEDSMEQKL